MNRFTTLVAAAILFATVTYGDSSPPDELNETLSTVVPVFAVTNTTPQAAISNLTAILQQMDPPKRLPVVLSVHHTWMENQPAITFRATEIRVDEILGVISQLSRTRLTIMHGATVLKEVGHWDWKSGPLTIGDRALQTLGLTSRSSKQDVKQSLHAYGIRFTVGCRLIMLPRITPNRLDIMLTLSPSDFDKARSIIILLNEGYTIEKNPNNASENIGANAPNSQR